MLAHCMLIGMYLFGKKGAPAYGDCVIRSDLGPVGWIGEAGTFPDP